MYLGIPCYLNDYRKFQFNKMLSFRFENQIDPFMYGVHVASLYILDDVVKWVVKNARDFTILRIIYLGNNS